MINKECYLCKNRKTIQRTGSVRDNPQLKILECASCGLVFLSSFDHIKKKFYENSRMHLKVYPDLSEIPAKKKYDIITMFHVLEHLPDPRTTLRKLSRFLKDKGQLIIEVPSAEYALLTLYGCEAFSHFTYWSCHLFLFTLNTLKELALQVNLKMNYIRQIQRYPLSNHLYWLAKGKPGGHENWHFLDSKQLNKAYEDQLSKLGKCDTLVISLSLSDREKND